MSIDGLHLSPFRGLRYAPKRVGSIAAVTSPPYDVVVRPDGLHDLEQADPYNIVRLILPQGADATTRNQKAADTLRRWQAEGVLTADPVPAFYVYEQRRGPILQRGLIGALRLSPPEQRVVLPHEDVMPSVVTERAGVMRATATHLEPLLLSYRGGNSDTGAAAAIERATHRAPLLATSTEDGFHHRLWDITAARELSDVATDLAQHQALIADGHHRWATYLRLQEERRAMPGPWDYGLVLLVDTARYPLHVQAIHRVLRKLPIKDAISGLGGAFRCRSVDGPLPQALDTLTKTPGQAFLLAAHSAFHLLDQPDATLLRRTIPSDRPALWRDLDATVLHATLLDTVWRVPDTPEHIGYLHDAAAAVAQAQRSRGTAVLMRPVTEDVVRDLAQQGITMPRKSTSFGPKPATGLVLRSLTLD